MMSLLVAYALLLLLAILWIARDSETIYIFDVFGRNFHYVWFDSGQRWKYVFTYGWRLVALCSLVFLNGLLSYRIYTVDPLEVGPAVQFMMFAVLLAASLTPIPWIYIAHRLRWQRRIRATVPGLVRFLEGTAIDSALAQTLDRADYNTDAPWTAWHPKHDEWESNEMWDALLPVVYLRNDPGRSALFPIDWETFLAWNIPADCVRINSDLPVHGAFDSSFRVESVQQLRGCPNWWLVRTEIRSELDAVIEGRG
jgi:hypothetical protein